MTTISQLYQRLAIKDERIAALERANWILRERLDQTVKIDAAFIERQIEWSLRTFGPGDRTQGVIDHIRKELCELETTNEEPEWVDIIILAIDGFWRAGYKPQEILDLIDAKHLKNEGRNWPDWRTQDINKAIEHIRHDTEKSTSASECTPSSEETI